jgi:hypothetical protein
MGEVHWPTPLLSPTTLLVVNGLERRRRPFDTILIPDISQTPRVATVGLRHVECPAMRKLRIAIVLLFGSIAAVTGGAVGTLQSPSRFSGHWVVTSVSPSRSGYDQFWLGTEATVTQDAASLVISRISPPPQREARFTFDGTESRNEYVVDGQRVVRDSRATLNGSSLLISTDTTIADGQRWLSNILRWSMDADGTLVVGDTEICGRGECPSVLTTLKFKRKPSTADRSR